MKDVSDNQTLDLIPVPRKRGRPASANSKTPSQRMRETRARDLERYSQDGQGVEAMTLTGLYDLLRWSVANSMLAHFDDASAEIRRRIQIKRQALHVEASQVEASQVEASQVEASQVEASQVEASQVEASQVQAPAPGLNLYIASLFCTQNQWNFEVFVHASDYNHARRIARAQLASKTVKVLRINRA